MEIFDHSCDLWCSVLWIQEPDSILPDGRSTPRRTFSYRCKPNAWTIYFENGALASWPSLCRTIEAEVPYRDESMSGWCKILKPFPIGSRCSWKRSGTTSKKPYNNLRRIQIGVVQRCILFSCPLNSGKNVKKEETLIFHAKSGTSRKIS